jgi:surface polysaccharide O-acyltransferase-like enzyme
MVKKRNSSIELLRIISILMVIISHYSVHNGVDNSLLPLSVNRILLESFSLGNIGVMLFVMITGYFMSVNKNGLGISKLLTLYLQVLFYSFGLYLLFIIFGYESFFGSMGESKKRLER